VFTLLESGEDPWDNLFQTFKTSPEFEKWHSHYLDVCTLIEHNITGSFKTLCSFLNLKSDNPSLVADLERMKEGHPCQYDSFYVPWGKGSIIHSLVDAILLYLPSFESQRD
jgi:hypothetical protein